MKKVLQKFGKYLLLDRLAQGGMAEIFRAWAPSVDGGGRLIALKCVQPDFGEDPEFLQMFRAEIRLTMGLNHPNIVQLYDFGEIEGRPFIAMELVEGKNLRQFTARVFQKGQAMPPEYAAHIIQQAAAGLHYAHAYKDKTNGESLNIVHRDISPQNLLLSYGGNLKIIDFGIAKAANNRQTTRAGVIKGKPSYLSPEQISGLPLDGRSDLFSLGVVFWETLTGRKLFEGETELAAVRMIEDCQNVAAPSSLNKSVPPDLDAIALKALAKDRNQRFKTGEELQRALHRFIYAYRPDFDPSEFGLYTQNIFKVEMEQEQQAIRALSVEAKELFGDANVTAVSVKQGPKAPERQPQKATTFASLSMESIVMDVHRTDPKKKKRELTDLGFTNRRKNRNGGFLVFVKLVILAVIAVGAVAYFPAIEAQFREHFQPVTRATMQESATAHPTVVGARVPVKLRIFPAGGTVRVLLDQKPVNPNSIEVSVGVTAKLSVVKAGFKSFEKDIAATSASDPVQVEALLEPDAFGTLSLHTTPTAEARISRNDLVWVQSTPLEKLKLPPGNYEIQLVNELLGMKKNLDLTILAGRSVDQDVTLDVVK